MRGLRCSFLSGLILSIVALSSTETAVGEKAMLNTKENIVNPDGKQNLPSIRLWGWQGMMHKGMDYTITVLAFEPRKNNDPQFFLWFYEHTLFDAVEKGQNSRHGPLPYSIMVKDNGTLAEIKTKDERELKLLCRATDDGADLELHVKNTSDYTWPEIASIIPCFNSGSLFPEESSLPLCKSLRDQEHTKTYFVGKNGLEVLSTHELHFNHAFRPQLAKESPEFFYPAFSPRWKTAKNDAYAGLMMREDDTGEWIVGIGWEDFLSCQGHNPLQCMHLGVRLGALAPGESRVIRGKVYFFKGAKEDCLNRYKQDFNL